MASARGVKRRVSDCAGSPTMAARKRPGAPVVVRCVAFFHKQYGTYASNPLVHDKGLTREQAERRDPKTNGKGGGLLRGKLHRAFPTPRGVRIATDLFAAE